MIRKKRKRDSFLPWLLLIADCVCVQSTLATVFWVRFGGYFFESTMPEIPRGYQNSFLITNIVLVIVMRQTGLYRARFLTFASEISRIFKAVVMGVVLLMALSVFFREFSFSRSFLLLSGLVLMINLSLARFLLGLFVMWVDRMRNSFRNIVIIGADEKAQKLAAFYKKNPRLSARVVGFLDNAHAPGVSLKGIPVVGKVKDLGMYLRSHREVHEVILSSSNASNEEVLKMIYACEKEMVAFHWIADILGLITSKMRVSYLAGYSLLSFTDSPLSEWENRLLKRCFDIFLSGCALLALLPVFGVLSLLIKLTTKGPVFYKQQRIGEDGKRFILYKFRTMGVDAEKETGPVWAKKNDHRRTGIGKFLRESNLDELPQFWNVWKGDMSLVGPRPERPFFVTRFKEDIPRYMARHLIKSGITGWAQVNGLRGDTSIEERTKYDLYYIENWSLLFDLKILLMTVFARKNAY